VLNSVLGVIVVSRIHSPVKEIIVQGNYLMIITADGWLYGFYTPSHVIYTMRRPYYFIGLILVLLAIGIPLASAIYNPELFKAITSDTKIMAALFIVFIIGVALMLYKKGALMIESLAGSKYLFLRVPIGMDKVREIMSKLGY